MEETYYAGAYWLARREKVEACARRAESLFRLLASCDPSLSQWFEKGATLEEALMHNIAPEVEGLVRVFSEQAQKEGRFADEGFSLALWNGQTQEAASSLSLLCGDASIWVSNLCLFYPPKESPASERVIQAPVLARILRAMAVAFEPEWGVVTSRALRAMLAPEPADAGTFIGWLTYFSHRRGPLPPLPSSVHTEPVEDKGTLVILTPERFTASNPAHVALARDVSELLAQAGLLPPLRPWNEGRRSSTRLTGWCRNPGCHLAATLAAGRGGRDDARQTRQVARVVERGPESISLRASSAGAALRRSGSNAGHSPQGSLFLALSR
ncbi:MAG TPA: immunity 52 family protein [Archangium sp.]|nr:immunity 52 family protein [Archangium sp.]